MADVVKASKERGDERCARLGREHALHAAEAQRDIDGDSLLDQTTGCDQPLGNHRDLDDDVIGKLGQLDPFGHHRLGVGAYHFGADRAIHQRADLPKYITGIQFARDLRQQGGIGGDAVDQAGLGRVADVTNVGRIEKDLHARSAAPRGDTVPERRTTPPAVPGDWLRDCRRCPEVG